VRFEVAAQCALDHVAPSRPDQGRWCGTVEDEAGSLAHHATGDNAAKGLRCLVDWRTWVRPFDSSKTSVGCLMMTGSMRRCPSLRRTLYIHDVILPLHNRLLAAAAAAHLLCHHLPTLLLRIVLHQVLSPRCRLRTASTMHASCICCAGCTVEQHLRLVHLRRQHCGK
jgi:hypothetical protein